MQEKALSLAEGALAKHASDLSLANAAVSRRGARLSKEQMKVRKMFC